MFDELPERKNKIDKLNFVELTRMETKNLTELLSTSFCLEEKTWKR